MNKKFSSLWNHKNKSYQHAEDQATRRTSHQMNLTIKVPISSKILFSHQILHFMQWTLAKKIIDLDKKRSF